MDWKEQLKALADSTPELAPSNVVDTDDTTPTNSKTFEPQKLTVSIEKKGRKGKTATIISGFTCDDSQLRELLTTLQKQLGTGGSARGGEILLQGECRQKAIEILRSIPNIKI